MDFHPGRIPRGRLSQPRRRRQPRTRHLVPATKKHPLTQTLASLEPFSMKQTLFNIFPKGTFHPRVESALQFTAATPFRLHSFVNGWKKNPYEKLPPQSEAVKVEAPPPMEAFWSPELAEAIGESVQLLQKHRFALRRLLDRWRSTKLEAANSHDLVTGDVPKRPVKIVDWKLRRVYTFEAATLHRDITTRLQLHDGFFEDPQSPRNPYTNSPLTLAQKVSVWHQLQTSGLLLSTAFIAYRSCSFILARFSRRFAIPLQLHALRATLQTPSDPDTQDRTLDFIRMIHEEHQMPFYEQSYWHCIVHYPELPLLQQWRVFVERYYRYQILFKDNPAELDDQHVKISNACFPLLQRQHELVALRNRDLRIRVAAAPPPVPAPTVPATATAILTVHSIPITPATTTPLASALDFIEAFQQLLL